MSGALQFVGVLTISVGLILALTVNAPIGLQIGYGLAGLIGSVAWFAAAEALNHLKAIRVAVESKN